MPSSGTIKTITLPNGNTYDINGVMTGAGSSAAGVSGLVPAPSIGDQTKFLRGDGTWAEGGSGGSDVFILETSITNASGSYTNTISNSQISADMVPIDIDYEVPSVIKADVEIVCNDGELIISCSNAVGTTDVTIYLMGSINLTAAEGAYY